VKIRRNRVDRLKPPDENPERIHLGLLGGGGEVTVSSPPQSILVELSTDQFVQTGDVLLAAPPDELSES